jgi:PAP2 superfamily protein
VALSRILAFRHWTSDVVASAVVGLVTAWIVTEAVVRRVEWTRGDDVETTSDV